MRFKYYLGRTVLFGGLFSLVLLSVFFLPALVLERFDFFIRLLALHLYHVPLVLYIIGLGFTTSFVVMVIYYFVQRHQYTRIESNLFAIQSGHYHELGRKKMTVNEKQSIHLQNIIRDMANIDRQLTEVTGQVQSYNEQPILYEGETKEEILENERHRLARELHDSVSQQLFAATMLVSALQKQTESLTVTATFEKQLATVSDIINNAQSEMRALLLHLRPVSLENRSLREGMIQLLNELMTKVQLKMIWDIEDVSLSKGVEDQLFRILQELLSNVLRHAEAHTLEVYLRVIGDQVLLRIVDDGKGFDTAKKEKAGSYGMRNIKERVSSIGGTMRIVSFIGEGTSVEINVPLNEYKGEQERD